MPESLGKRLHRSLNVLKSSSPYTKSPAYQSWFAAIEEAYDLAFVLKLIEQFRPGLLLRLTEQAFEEDSLHRENHPDIEALCRRYARRLEPLR